MYHPYLHGVIWDQENIFYGQGEYIRGQETRKEEAHRQLVVCQVAIGTNQECVTWAITK